MVKLMKPSMFYNDENTKIKYPVYPGIMMKQPFICFIKYCKYNTGAILDDKLAAIYE